MKRLVAACALLASASMSAAANAQEGVFSGLDPEPYIGASIGHSFIDVSSENEYEPYIPDEFQVFTLNAGLRLHSYIGAEIGYFRSMKEDVDYAAEILGNRIAGSGEAQFYGYYADLTGYLPLSYLTNEESDIEFLGLIGISNVTAKWKGDFNVPLQLPVLGADNEESDTALRYGIGLQYHVSESFSAKAMFRYIDIDFDSGVNGGQIVDIGVNYKF